ncbi:MAG TPA: hypothetical protein VGA03_09060 [Anaerolineales bacterium]
MSEKPLDPEECISEGPQSALERHLVEDYLLSKGYHKEDLQKLPKEQAKALMREACTYASLKLAELEAKSQFRNEIRSPH